MSSHHKSFFFESSEQPDDTNKLETEQGKIILLPANKSSNPIAKTAMAKSCLLLYASKDFNELYIPFKDKIRSILNFRIARL